MRRVFLLVIAALPICAIQARAAPECRERGLGVTVQIHDYVHLPGERLSRAMEIVTRMYDAIGVRIDWLGVLQRDTGRGRSTVDEKASRAPVAQITVIILTPAMAARGRIPDGVLGFAAVPVEGGMGRIAYVIYDRIQRLAGEGRVNEVPLLGFVLAHETGHLLLGRGARSRAGLMKCQWDSRKIQEVDSVNMGFSELQAFQIRNTLEKADSRAAGTCTTTADAYREEPEDTIQDRDATPR
jgi:hypothetical protein